MTGFLDADAFEQFVRGRARGYIAIDLAPVGHVTPKGALGKPRPEVAEHECEARAWIAARRAATPTR